MELVRHTVPWGPTYIAPLGDIQWSGSTHEIAWDHLKRHIDEALELGAWFLGMGDYIDFMSPSNRNRMEAAGLYDRTRQTIDDKGLELTQQLYDDLLKPTVGRWIGLHEGHHFLQLKSGATTDMKLCELLGAPFLGTQAITEVRFERGTTSQAIQIWSFHGAGGGQTVHAPLLKLAALARDWEGIDIFLIGHMTKIAAAPQPRARANFRPGTPRLEHRDMRLVGTGGWLKALVEARRDGQVPRGNYVEKAGMNLVTLGAPLLRIVPHMRVVVGAKDVFQPTVDADPGTPTVELPEEVWDPDVKAFV